MENSGKARVVLNYDFILFFYRAALSPNAKDDGDDGDDGCYDPDVSMQYIFYLTRLSIKNSRRNISRGPPLVVIKISISNYQ